MPLTWMPEGTVVRPTDDEMRAAAKYCQLVYDSIGFVPTPYPEGPAPLPGDDLERLMKKINYMLAV